mgnify:CR=1 FL=1
MKQTNGKGFTLAELLIVVAIIAVLVAIAIPVFTKQLHNAKATTDMANLRAYYAELQADFLANGKVHEDLETHVIGTTITNKKYKHLDDSISEINLGSVLVFANKDAETNPDVVPYTIFYDCGDVNGCHRVSYPSIN